MIFSIFRATKPALGLSMIVECVWARGSEAPQAMHAGLCAAQCASKRFTIEENPMEDSQILDLYFERSEDAIRETDRKYGAYCFLPAQTGGEP